MDGENNGKPYFLTDDLGVPLFSETSICVLFPSFLLVKRWWKFIIQPLEILDKPWGPWVKKPGFQWVICQVP